MTGSIDVHAEAVRLGIRITRAREGSEVYQMWADRVLQALSSERRGDGHLDQWKREADRHAV